MVFLGALTSGEITGKGILVSGVTAVLIAISQFKDYWQAEEKEYCATKAFSFITA